MQLVIFEAEVFLSFTQTGVVREVLRGFHIV